jgi:hypothetical protein
MTIVRSIIVQSEVEVIRKQMKSQSKRKKNPKMVKTQAINLKLLPTEIEHKSNHSGINAGL